MTWQTTIEAKLPKLHSPLLLEGLPGIGNVGKIVTDFLVEELKAQKLYSFFSYSFPHSVFVNEKDLVDMPKLEIYHASLKKHDLLILTGDIQPIDEESCYSFCEEILNIAKQFDCHEVITTGGIGLQHVPEKPQVYCTSNDPQLLNQYIKDFPVQKSIYGVVGPIVGVSGVLIGLAKRRNIKGIALLAETFGHPMYLGIKGAQEILAIIEKKVGQNLNLKQMSKEIIELEKDVMKKTKEWEAVTSAGAKAKQKEINYIG
ncbi:PAC2 family protein [Candidatus Woesearchaeota archaeon]|nr:PAC2 family protein [Candidatus Woesearchaeota archaeon]